MMRLISHLASFWYLPLLNNIRIDLQLLVNCSICRLKMNQLTKINEPFFCHFFFKLSVLYQTFTVTFAVDQNKSSDISPNYWTFYTLNDLSIMKTIVSCSPSLKTFLLCPLTVPNPHRYVYISAHVLWRRLSSIWERPYKASCSTLLALLYPLPNCSPSGITTTMGTKTCKLDMPVSFSFHCTKEFMKQMVTKTWKSIQMYACCRNQGRAKRARHTFIIFENDLKMSGSLLHLFDLKWRNKPCIERPVDRHKLHILRWHTVHHLDHTVFIVLVKHIQLTYSGSDLVAVPLHQ